MTSLNSGTTIARPSSAATLAGTTGGSLDTSATYGYKVTFVTGYGETLPNVTAATIATSTNNAVNLTAIPTGEVAVTARKIYRTIGGGSSYLLLATISDNTTTTYADIIADGSLGAAAPLFSTADSVQRFEGLVKHTNNCTDSVTTAIVAGVGGTSAAATQLTAKYNVVATVTTTNDSIKLQPASTNNIGLYTRIVNKHANTLRIYPFDGQTINGGSADAAITLATTVAVSLVCDSATNWTTL